MRNIKSKVVIAVLLLCIVFMSGIIAGCKNSKDDKIVVAMELAYPPFEMKDNEGNPSGVSVDLAKAFGEYMGKEVVIENTAWDGLIPSLQTGKADMVLSSMSTSETRRQSVDFSNPYSKSLLAILANKDSNISSIDDINQPGKTVVVKAGTSGFLFAKEKLSNCNVLTLADESACVTEVVQGKADGFLYDQLSIYRSNKKNLDTTNAIFIPYQDTDYWCAAFKKGNTELLTKFNEFIEKYKNENGFDKITEKYLSEEQKAFEKLGFSWFFDVK